MNGTKGWVVRGRGAAVLVGIGLLALPCMAQTQDTAPPPPPNAGQGGYGGPHRGGPDHRAEMLQRQLNLTPDQYTQVRSLLEGERSQMQTLHSNTSLSQDEMHTQMMSLHQGTEGKIRALLTPDQASRYDAMQARMREHRQEREEGGAPPPAGAPQL